MGDVVGPQRRRQAGGDEKDEDPERDQRRAVALEAAPGDLVGAEPDQTLALLFCDQVRSDFGGQFAAEVATSPITHLGRVDPLPNDYSDPSALSWKLV